MAGWLKNKFSNAGYKVTFLGLVEFANKSPLAAIEVLGGAAKLISDLAGDLGLDAPLSKIATEEALHDLVYLVDPSMAEKIEFGLLSKSSEEKKSGVRANMYVFALAANYFNLIPRLRNYDDAVKDRKEAVFGLLSAGASGLELVRSLPATATAEEKGRAGLAAMSDRLELLNRLVS